MSLADVRKRIAAACATSGRNPASVALVAVTKSRSAQDIRGLLGQDHSVFGENRVQEAAEKFPALRGDFPSLALHFIGHLQTNKAKEAVSLFDVIETVDSIRLAEALGHEMEKQKRALPCFIQVNTGDEEQKGGVAPRDLPALFRFCTEQAKLRIEGLMCIPPAREVPDLHFALLHKLGQGLDLRCLSMGMSGDFETAIRYGATHVRIGTALFES